MRKRSIFTIPAAAAGVIALGLTLGTFTPPYEGVAAPTPTAASTFVLPEPLLAAATCTEDEPCWDCESMGNLICGTMPEDLKRSAWKAWDANGGAAQLLVNPNARVELTGYSVTDPYGQDGPALGVTQLALHDSGVWYIFTADTI
jgi:hypothetical protein